MHPEHFHGVIGLDTTAADILPSMTDGIQQLMPPLLAALDAAEAARDRRLAEELVTQIYRVMGSSSPAS